MSHLNEIAPVVFGLLLVWFVGKGALELFKETSVVVMKRTKA